MNVSRLKICSLLFILFLTGCQSSAQTNQVQPVDSTIEVKEHDGTMSEIYSHASILSPRIALTFNGLADNETMLKLLKVLDQCNMKATFFVEGTRVAQDPELVKDILAKGHEVENGTLTFPDMTDLNYEETYKEIYLTNQVFEEHLGYTPKYVRSRSGDSTDNMRLATKTLNMKGVVASSINPKDRNMQSAEEITDYIHRFINSGSVIHLNTYINPAIIDVVPLLSQLGKEQGYAFSTLTDVLDEQYIAKPLESIEGYDAIKVNLDYENVKPNMYYRKNTSKKEVALTFDDWASEERLKEILDVLDKYNVHSTFFLIGKGVEKEPQLARLIVEKGHEVASHSYNHLDVTTMTPEELQEDVVKAHKALTYALQEEPLLYFRPNKGAINEESAKIIAATGIKSIAMYDIASFDWNLEYTVSDIYNRVMSRIGPGKVIVMHILDGTKTVEALPVIIEKLQKDGYSFAKMSTWIEEDSNKKVN
ncbi:MULTISPECIES: polysaccharide deacetylase family protein [unclassified Lysinibacillus]|uniref:polysaccharide deacetylase family protein n=1 Tax=unclassified Lysinibacillus TaxID=2636778 RepID=UPI0009D5CCA7|nr:MULTISPECIES: polysaccharide deacetylase family protein [unclassified Lysinibacillus]SKB70349.1 Peptidoglycan/xylan/chitin deacetylase, PgdA/CDA1 family [Lysinibacillus sp. AC-3]